MMSVTGQKVGASTTVAPADPNSLQGTLNHGNTSQYYPTISGPIHSPWPAQAVADNHSTENGSSHNLSYQQEGQQTELYAKHVQDGSAAQSQTYSSYAGYQTPSDPYGYGNTTYPGYYNGYQQPSNQSYPQPVGVYQNSGAPYQPNSSFQNTVSYAGTSGYSSTYYNPGDYQTSGAYTGSSYSSQTNSWAEGNYANYTHQYPNYSQDSSSAYGSSSSTTLSYEQQWADYYSQTEVTCAPGTEKTTVTSTSTLTSPIPSVSGGYAAPTTQPQSSYVAHWQPDAVSTNLPLTQSGPVVAAHEGYKKSTAHTFQDHHASSSQATFQKPLDVNPSYPGVQAQHQTAPALQPGHYSQYPIAHQAPQTYQQPMLPSPSADTRRISKLQIPTNPRIALNLGAPKIDKDSSTTTAVAKPAYISVSELKSTDKALSSHASDSILKTGMFPASLRGYVERALARCKDERQMILCQETMKGMITKATADGTLHTKDWDTEPLFPLADTSAANERLQDPSPVSLLPKRSPSRRSKSRWEPMPEEKLKSMNQDSVKYGGGFQCSGRDKKFTAGKPEKTDGGNNKFSISNQTGASKNEQRPFKRQCFGDNLNAAEYGDASSDSDKEQNLTAYYSGATRLANSPEERKRREHRSKRFEKGNSQRAEVHNSGPKTIGAGNLYSRRATALVLSKTFEDGGSRAVEDIDWDSLTVKGTCQEIEKRYLRLTSAPDSSTVRPEDVLERALHVVQDSQKNYLYKCDQLKSIRQDLTVQRIRNELTVKVYETHARLALEFGDLPEYNQCQSQLKSLYTEGISGCHMEFSAYNLLGVILHSNSRRDLSSSMSRLSDEAKRDEAVKHALAVRAAVASGNYVMFFRLYKTAPNLNTCLMDLYVEKMRFEAIKCMARAYRPTVPVSYIAQMLGFRSPVVGGEDADSLEECAEWLKAHGACLITENSEEMQLDAKASSSSLYMPEPEDAVAHGDTNLAVNDFLTRTST